MNPSHLAYFHKIETLHEQMNIFTNNVKNEIVLYCQNNQFGGELSATLDEDGNLIVSMPSLWMQFISSQKFIISHKSGVYVRLNFHANDSHKLAIDFLSDGNVNILNSAINYDGKKLYNVQSPTLQYDYNDEALIPAIIENLFQSATFD
ncbi:hypothetical protein [Enterobacter kobei]|uniref:hypothetical protein n=1 Tax=Enterobacter kobei TaxID=208224 RepID=UPI003BE3F69B|nr:hypothetical protein [Enterobacter kobei]